MGEEIVEYEPGEDCPTCWGPGKEFGDYPPPKRVIITGSGFTGACAVCNDSFVAMQNPIMPCQWDFDDGVVQGYWNSGIYQPSFLLRLSGGADCHVAGGPHCILETGYDGHTMRVS